MTSLVEGVIEIDGINISHLTPVDLRQRINVVPQEPFLMPGTVRFSLDPYERASDDEIINALEKVNCGVISAAPVAETKKSTPLRGL
jgi:ATP-binding cassette subfamily C (CFTR/MRP) protein 1